MLIRNAYMINNKLKNCSIYCFCLNNIRWSPQSSDLNIIENIWSLLKRHVAKRFPGTIEELWKVAKKDWYQIDDVYIRNLYASIPRRLDAVIKMKGGHSK